MSSILNMLKIFVSSILKQQLTEGCINGKILLDLSTSPPEIETCKEKCRKSGNKSIETWTVSSNNLELTPVN